MGTVLSLQNIIKEFDSVRVLNDINISIQANEVIGLVGENGAGKSTLMKILIGVYQPESGFICNSKENKITIKSPHDAARNGLGMVFQEGSLISGLNITENLFLGHEQHFCKAKFLLQNLKRKAETAEILDIVGLSQYSWNTSVDELSTSEKQMLEIGRLLWIAKLYEQQNPILILDEPTTVLSKKERDILFNHIKNLTDACSFIFISHRIEEILELSDRVVVLRDGNLIRELPIREASMQIVEELIIGKPQQSVTITPTFDKTLSTLRKNRVLLDVKELTIANAFSSLSFQLYEGEILSFAGLVGSGKEELIDTFFGLHKIEHGSITFENKTIKIRQPEDAIRQGFGLIPIDRRNEGLATELSVLDNISLLVLKYLKEFGLLSKKKNKEFVLKQVKKFNVKTPKLNTECKFLSGGNQQKVVLAKWFSTNAKIFILNHPTRGIDVGSKREIYNFVKSMTKEGYSFIVLCDSLDEDISFADRIILMKEFSIIDKIDLRVSPDVTPSHILAKIL